MKILIISTTFPYPLIDGAKLKLYNIIRQLAEKGHDLTLIAITSEVSFSLRERLSRYCKDIFLIKEKKTFWSRLINLLSWKPFEGRFSSAYYTKRIFKLIIDINPDVLYFDLSSTAVFLPLIKKRRSKISNLKKVIIAPYDSLALFYYEKMRFDNNILRKIYYFASWFKAVLYERYFYSFADICILVSVEDQKWILRFAPNLRTCVIPNGVDVNYFKPLNDAAGSLSIVFSGNMDFMPNHTGILFFINSIWPRLRQKYRNIKLFIIGRRPISKLQRLNGKDGIVVTGYVEDVRPYINSSSVYICPVIMRGGLKNKILEAMAMQKALVVTPQAHVSFADKFISGEHLFVAPVGESFLSCVDKLLVNEDFRLSMAKTARDIVVREYSWQSIMNQLEEVLK